VSVFKFSPGGNFREGGISGEALAQGFKFRPFKGLHVPIGTWRILPDVFSEVLAWHSGNALDSINVVTLHRARLVPGWVTVSERVNHSGTEPRTQVDSA